MPADTSTERRLWPLIKSIKFAMFTAHQGNGHLHSRPMTTRNKTMPDDKLWFFMSGKGETSQELAQQPQVRAIDHAGYAIGAFCTSNASQRPQRALTTFTKTPR